MRRTILVVAAAILTLAAGPRARQQELLGEWHGTSVCTDLAAAPACRDEVVIYRCRPAPKDSVILAAYRITNGAEVFMGDQRFGFDAASGEWIADFNNTRVHVRFHFRVADTVLTGTMVNLPGDKQVRAIRVVRAAQSARAGAGAMIRKDHRRRS